MPRVFHQLFYHVVWATKNREPQLVPALRQSLIEAIQDKCRRLDCRVHALNAVEDHVHVVIEIPPVRSVSVVIGQIKGASAHALNQLRPGSIHWQDGYGVLTFRRAELATVTRYVAPRSSATRPIGSPHSSKAGTPRTTSPPRTDSPRPHSLFGARPGKS